MHEQGKLHVLTSGENQDWAANDNSVALIKICLRSPASIYL